MKTFSFGLIFGILFGTVLGLFLYPALESLLPCQKLYIQGVVQYSPAPDHGLSGMPPEGYYIEIQMPFYLDQIDPQFLNKTISVNGPLSITSGPDGFPCFPKLKIKDIQEIKNRSQENSSEN